MARRCNNDGNVHYFFLAVALGTVNPYTCTTSTVNGVVGKEEEEEKWIEEEWFDVDRWKLVSQVHLREARTQC